jgi:hypothetical protein
MIEVWKYWWQLLGILPSDELQRLRAENEILKAQLEISKSHARLSAMNAEAIASWTKTPEDLQTAWAKVFQNPFEEKKP